MSGKVERLSCVSLYKIPNIYGIYTVGVACNMASDTM